MIAILTVMLNITGYYQGYYVINAKNTSRTITYMVYELSYIVE